jgi:hypothetical protein
VATNIFTVVTTGQESFQVLYILHMLILLILYDHYEISAKKMCLTDDEGAEAQATLVMSVSI